MPRNEIELCKRHKKNKTIAPIGEQGNLFNLDLNMSQYLFQTALQLSTGDHEAKRNAIETQSEKKKENTIIKRLEGANNKYIDQLHHCDMFNLAGCLESCA